MALHPDFPKSPHAILDPGMRWFPADEAMRESSMEKLMPPLVASLRRKVKEFREVPKKSVFNRIIGDSALELRFAAFLENCGDDEVLSYAKNYLAVNFKLDYV